jgi:hypothetical protein
MDAVLLQILTIPSRTLASVKLCIEHGKSPLAAGYIFSTVSLCGALRDINTGYQLVNYL